MSAGANPYREVAVTCPFCGAELGSDQGRAFGAMRVCGPCGTGDLDRALRRWGFECTLDERSKNESTRFSFVEITRPTELEILVKMRPEGFNKKVAKLFGARELRSGHGDFDGAVFIEADPDQEVVLGRLLEVEGARESILALLRLGGWDKRDNSVDLTGKLVGAVVAWSRDGEVPDRAEILGHLLALAIRVERLARRP